MTYFIWVWQVISSNFQCFPWCCHPCGAIESSRGWGQRAPLEVLQWDCGEAVPGLCAQLSSLLGSGSVGVSSSSRCRGRGADKHPEATRRDGAGPWPCASRAVLCDTERKESDTATWQSGHSSTVLYLQPSQIDQDIRNIPCATRHILFFEQSLSQPTNWGGLEVGGVTRWSWWGWSLLSVSDLPVSGWALWCYCFRLRWCFYTELKQLGALDHSSPQAWAVGRGGSEAVTALIELRAVLAVDWILAACTHRWKKTHGKSHRVVRKSL